MIELEKTYLIREIPESLKSCKFKEIIDVYFPKDSHHPKIRLRKNGDTFELTKKEPVKEGDASNQNEENIVLDKNEFDFLNGQIDGKRVHKIRYYYNYRGNIAEIDIFQDKLSGLVLVDFEFNSLDEKDSFQMPDFCLTDVTQELFLAGGMLCGKTYQDIEDNLKELNYRKIYFK